MTGTDNAEQGGMAGLLAVERRIGIACDAAGHGPSVLFCEQGDRGPEGFHGDLRGWGIEAQFETRSACNASDIR